MSKFTPGPWEIGVYKTTDEFRAHEEHVAVMVSKTQMLLALTGPTLDKTSVADALLIAAAPELLELVKELLESERRNGVYKNEERIQQAERVIAKAEGREK